MDRDDYSRCNFYGCSARKMKGFVHKCPMEDCQNRYGECTIHCKYCNRAKEDGNRYCFMHKCHREDCQNESLNCDIHCNLQSCNRAKEAGNRYCSAHTCHVKGCNEIMLYSCSYCDKHRCVYCGKNIKLPEFKYCIECKCPVEGCPKPCDGSVDFDMWPCYCRIHKCESLGCPSEQLPDFWYCIRCKCLVQGCPMPYDEESNYYCSRHKCVKFRCHSMRLPDKEFCMEHIPFEELVNVAQNERKYLPNDIWTMVKNYK
jgi:hypothetical protein